MLFDYGEFAPITFRLFTGVCCSWSYDSFHMAHILQQSKMFAIKWFDLFVEDIMYFAYVHSEMGHSVLQFVVYNGLCVDVSDVCNFCV